MRFLFSLVIMTSAAILTNPLSGHHLLVLQVVAQQNLTQGEAGQLQNQSRGTIENMTSNDQVDTTITRQDLDPVLNYLFKAREGLLGENNLSSAFEAISDAGNQIFKLKEAQTGTKGDTSSQLDPLQRQIELARSSLVIDKNQTVTLRHLNAADTIFIEITQSVT